MKVITTSFQFSSILSPFDRERVSMVTKGGSGLAFKNAFTLIELLVVIAIIAILASLGLSSAKAMVEKGKAAQCLGNMKNIGIAALAYAADNNMKLPMTSHKGASNAWTNTLQPYSGQAIEFKCPADPNISRERSYAINDMLTPNPCQALFLDFSYLSKIDRPSETIYFAEAVEGFTLDHIHFSEFFGDQVPSDAFEELVDVHRHGKQANYLFADCHAEQLTWDSVKKRLENTADRITDPTRE
jgi:prepilin-type N-terminal cleavage/methylation domain-containing protein/prepilin-type processing-associated H-X9-DG protein